MFHAIPKASQTPIHIDQIIDGHCHVAGFTMNFKAVHVYQVEYDEYGKHQSNFIR